MELGIARCVMFIMKGVKKETTERIEQSSSENIKTFGEKDNNQYQGIFEGNAIKQK